MAAAEKTIPFDAADQRQVQERARTAKDKAKDLDLALKAIMEHRQTRAWVWDLISACGLYRASVRAGDPHMTYFHEGERNVGLRLLAQLHRACPDLYAKMTEENSDG